MLPRVLDTMMTRGFVAFLKRGSIALVTTMLEVIALL